MVLYFYDSTRYSDEGHKNVNLSLARYLNIAWHTPMALAYDWMVRLDEVEVPEIQWSQLINNPKCEKGLGKDAARGENNTKERKSENATSNIAR